MRKKLSLINGGKDYCTFGVKMTEKGNVIKYADNGKVEEGEEITSTSIWIRSVTDKDCVNTYFFSTGGKITLK
jgi:hypothetical protein